MHRLRPALAVAVAAAAIALGIGQVASDGALFAAIAGPLKHVPKPAAVESYRRGRYEWNRRTPESLRAALSDFTQAVVSDPDYAEGYVGLADTYNLLREYTAMPSDQAYPKAQQAAERALALDNRLAGAHAAMAFVKFHWSWDVAGARREFERAIALDPRSAAAHHWFATALLELGAYGEASAHIDAAQALDPQSASIRADKGLILAESGRSGEAEALLVQLAAEDPRFLSPHAYLAALYFDQRRFPDYLTELRNAAELQDDDSGRRVATASEAGWRKGGAPGMLNAMLTAEQALYDEGKITDFQLALAFANAGDTDRTLRHLASAVARHDPGTLGALALPVFRAARAKPEFRALFAAVLKPG